MSLQKIFDSLHCGDLTLCSADEIKESCLLILQAQRLDPAAISTLDACYTSGPLFDGDIPSKSARDRLVELEFVSRVIVRGNEGYNACTQKGFWARRVLIGSELLKSESEAK